MVFSRSAARGAGGCCGSLRPSIRFHGDSAIEVCSLGDGDARRTEIAAHDRRLTDLDGFLGAHVALHATIDVDGGGIDLGDHFALLANDDSLLVLDRALDAAFDLDVFLGFQLAFEAQGRAKHRHAFVRRVTAHQLLPWVAWPDAKRGIDCAAPYARTVRHFAHAVDCRKVAEKYV